MRIVEAGGRTALRASGGAGGMALACGVVITMCAQSTKQSPDAVIAWVARLQHGVVARQQLLQTGVTTAQIALRLRDGRLRTIHRGVYLVGPVPTDLAYSQAALLACGSDAVLSHRSAAGIWGLLPYPSKAYPWVTVPSSQHVVRPRIVVRRRSLHRRDIRTRERLRLVSPPRAVLDCAEVLDDPYELEAMVAEAAFRGLASDAEVREQVRRSARRPGVPHVRKILDIEGGPTADEVRRRAMVLGTASKSRVLPFRVQRESARIRGRLPLAPSRLCGRARRLGRAFEPDRFRARPGQVGSPPGKWN